MGLKGKAFALLAALVTAHIGVLTYASVACIHGWLIPREEIKCETLGASWTRSTEAYISVILALLVPTGSAKE